MRHLTAQQLSASLDGALVGVSLELVVRHLATCHECRDRHARLVKQDDTLRHLLAWDPGAEYFEDASIRLETILDAESRGSAPPRIAELEAQLPRVTLDEVLRTAREAVTPKLQFPEWMQREAPATPRSVVPTPAPREPRPRALAVDPQVLAHKEAPTVPPAVVTPPLAAAPPVLAAPPVVDMTALARTPVEPVFIDTSTPEPPFTEVTGTRPLARTSRSRVFPRWARPLAWSVAGLAFALFGLSALPPVIRIPQPGLPRIELVPRPGPPKTHTTAVVARTTETGQRTMPEPSPASVTRAPIASSIPRRADPTPASQTESRANPAPPTPERTTPAPIADVAPQPMPPAASSTADTNVAEDWPLLCGEVMDDSGAPVAGARVMLADLDMSARTDKRGRFCLAAPPGDRTLSVVALGFATTRQAVSLGAQTLEIRIRLRPNP